MSFWKHQPPSEFSGAAIVPNDCDQTLILSTIDTTTEPDWEILHEILHEILLQVKLRSTFTNRYITTSQHLKTPAFPSTLCLELGKNIPFSDTTVPFLDARVQYPPA